VYPAHLQTFRSLYGFRTFLQPSDICELSFPAVKVGDLIVSCFI